MRDDISAGEVARPGGAMLRFTLACVLALAVALLFLASRPAAHVFNVPITEDAYYALSVARNIAAGHGFAIEPGIVTNGFQPMFTVLEAAAFALGGTDEAAVRWVIVLSWLFHVAGAALLAFVAGDAWPVTSAAERGHRRALAAFLYLAAPLVVNHAYNGLETGAVLFFYIALARALQIGGAATRRGAALCGALAGLLVLARIDSAIVVTVIALAISARGLRDRPLDAITRGAMFGMAAVAVSLPWWVFNIVQFGSPMPTSGLAQQGFAISPLRIAFAATAFGKVLVPWLFFGSIESAVAPIPGLRDIGITIFDVARWSIVAVAVGLLWRAVRSSSRANGRDVAAGDARRCIETMWMGGAIAVGLAMIVGYYALNFTAYWFYYRYFAPMIVASVVVVAIVAGRVSTGGRPKSPVVLSVGAMAVQGLTLLTLAWNGVGLYGQTDYRDQVTLVDLHVSPGEAVAAGQSGTLGFFRAHVVNLDGKVNRDVIGQQDRLSDYLRDRGVRWFCDWPHYVRKALGVPIDPLTGMPAAEGNGWRLVAVRGYFYLYEDATRRPDPLIPAPDEAIAMNQRARRGSRPVTSGGQATR